MKGEDSMRRPLELTTGGVHWEVQPAWLGADPDRTRAQLFGPEGLRLTEWLASGAARAIKHNNSRTVYHVVLPGLDFYLKHYRVADRRARLREMVRPSKARMEYERILGVAARGVPTLVPLGLGETCAEGPRRASYLATRTIASAQPLHLFLETTFLEQAPRTRSRFRQRLAVALGQLLARMHQAGITHHDLHPGNLLLQLGPDGTPGLYLIDLHDVHLGAPLDWPTRRANLVLLNRWFSLRAERADRLRFWHAYEAERGVGPSRACGRRASLPREVVHHRAREVVRDLERRTLASNLRFWRGLDGRCLGDNRYFRRLATDALVGHAVTDLDPAALAPLLEDPDAPFARKDVIVHKDSPNSSVVEFDLTGPDGPRRVIYKRFAVANWTDPLIALLRPTPALRSYVLGHAFRQRCLPTPRPLAVWHRVRYGLRQEGYLLTEKVPEAVDLLGHVERLAALPAGERLRALRGFLDEIARLVSRLHRRHLSHRDLKAANLLVSPQAWFVSSRGLVSRAVPPLSSHLTGHVWFIDLVGARRYPRLRRSRRLQNLARLHASFHNHPALTRTDKLRFLRAYLHCGLCGRFGWKRWWRQVQEATEAKVEQNRRRGRPLG